MNENSTPDIKQHAIDAHAIFTAAINYCVEGFVTERDLAEAFCKAFAKRHAITFTPATLKQWQRELTTGNSQLATSTSKEQS